MSSVIQRLSIEAVDALLFRDGRPFTQADGGAGEATTVFPPHPPALVGAIRMLLARGEGFGEANTSWPAAKLGNGANWQREGTLGPLRFSAPRLTLGGGPLFAAPVHLARNKSGDLLRLLPSRTSLDCDLGDAVRLPMPDRTADGVKPLEGAYLTRNALTSVLSGALPANSDPRNDALAGIHEAHDLWSTETRTGIALKAGAKTVHDGLLYSASYTRPGEELGLEIDVEGAPPGRSGLQALSGGHRMASFTVSSVPDRHASLGRLPTAPNTLSGSGYLLVALSPMLLPSMPRPGEIFPGTSGRLVSACLGRPVPIGGWDSQARAPIAMRQAVPAGSVWFLKADDPQDALSLHGQHLGEATEWGFGQVVVGRWDDIS